MNKFNVNNIFNEECIKLDELVDLFVLSFFDNEFDIYKRNLDKI